MTLYERQCRYDRLHHEKRLADLDGGKADHFSSHEQLFLRDGSIECLRLIRDHGMSTNSVDLNDAEYMAELDSFAETTSASVSLTKTARSLS